MGSSVFSARLSGRSSATSRHGLTSRNGYFHVSNVQCSSLEITCSWDTSIFRDDGPPHIPSIYTSFLPLNPFPWSQRDGGSLAGNECRGCVISASVCRANRMSNERVDIFLAAPCPCSGEDGGIFGYFGPVLKERRSNWLPSETG